VSDRNRVMVHEEARDCLADLPGHEGTAAAVSAALVVPRSTVRRYLEDAAVRGWVTRERRGRVVVYRLAPYPEVLDATW